MTLIFSLFQSFLFMFSNTDSHDASNKFSSWHKFLSKRKFFRFSLALIHLNSVLILVEFSTSWAFPRWSLECVRILHDFPHHSSFLRKAMLGASGFEPIVGLSEFFFLFKKYFQITWITVGAWTKQTTSAPSGTVIQRKLLSLPLESELFP